ncbi:hypothetical protein [Mucilaginibacter dorajii]|uniref:Uncharacterized protein n=1 Tax=Mucilaginibacter dorajii TaxID=692994 RepID=A0ABP7QY12_9SPHI|nr:hypothetical protein [Mucilaginibacter dorajii]MCS3732386.1 hypothetical protein [Mucilaginibacter dorajii]
MSLPLRITFNDTDYTYTVLTRSINKETTAIKISLLGEEFTIVRNQQHQWYAMETSIGDKDDLLCAIAKNVALRYRL